MEESENIEFTIEKMFLAGTYSQEKRDRLVNVEVEKRHSLDLRICEIDALLDVIVKAEATK